MDKIQALLNSEFLNINEIVTQVVIFLPKLAMAVIVFLAFWLLFRLTRTPLKAVLGRSGLESFFVNLLVDKIYRLVVILFGFVAAASQTGINVSAALAGLGVAGLAVGFAAQDILANVIGGFTIFMDRPFNVGDFVTLNDQYGRVNNITLRSTRIRTPRNTYVVIPNKHIVDSVLINHSKHGETRVDVPVGIAYKENIPQARGVLLEAVNGIDGVLDKPEPTVVAGELGDSSVNLHVRVWIGDAATERDIEAKVVEHSKLALDAAGIEIPFPHLQLFWDDVDDRVVKKISVLAGGSAGGSSAA